jgi:hypothetical protein
VKIVAYYSVGTAYEREAGLLRASLEAANMPHVIVPSPDRGNWYANTAAKPSFIARMRKELSGPIVYVDVDAYVHENCEAFFDELGERGFDFAAHMFAGPAKGFSRTDVCGCLRGQPCTRQHRLLSGTLFFGDTPGARRMLAAWIALNKTLRDHGMPQGGGQKNLWYLLTCLTGDYRLGNLPGRYCFVFDKPWAYRAGEPRIIEHTIASRDNRAGPTRHTAPRAGRIRALWEKVGGG